MSGKIYKGYWSLDKINGEGTNTWPVGQTELSIQADLKMMNSLERVNNNILMVAHTMENGTKISSMEWVSNHRPMEVITSANGIPMKRLVLEWKLSQTVRDT